jgi:DNA repair exonuclease SbcCD ATPase subunit
MNNTCPTCRKEVDRVFIPKQKYYGLYSSMNDAINVITKNCEYIDKYINDNPDVKQLSKDLTGAKRRCEEIVDKYAKDEKDMFATMKMYEVEHAKLEQQKQEMEKDKQEIEVQKRNLDELMNTIQETMEFHQQEKQKLEQTNRDMATKIKQFNDQIAQMKSEYEKKLAYYDSMMKNYKAKTAFSNHKMSDVKRFIGDIHQLRELVSELVITRKKANFDVYQ